MITLIILHSHCSCNICQEQGTVAMNFKVVIYIRNHVYLILYTFTLNVCIWSNETICPYQVDIVSQDHVLLVSEI